MSADVADGLYRVVERSFVAGFVVEAGKVIRCAPILRKRIAFWMSVAVLVEG